MQVKKNGPGSYLKALDMYFYVDFTSSDPSEWRLLKMVYNRQVFPSTDEFMKAYRSSSVLYAHGSHLLTVRIQEWHTEAV